MTVTKEYWDFARECAQWAVEAKDQLEKDHFLDMAKAWTELALLEAGLVNGSGGRPQTEAALAPTLRSQPARELSFATPEPQRLL
jgi:hypothetical protein